MPLEKNYRKHIIPCGLVRYLIQHNEDKCLFWKDKWVAIGKAKVYRSQKQADSIIKKLELNARTVPTNLYLTNNTLFKHVYVLQDKETKWYLWKILKNGQPKFTRFFWRALIYHHKKYTETIFERSPQLDKSRFKIVSFNIIMELK